jgi:hypothetical protein
MRHRSTRASVLFLFLLPAGVLCAEFLQEDRERGPELEALGRLRVEGIALDGRGRPLIATSGGLFIERERRWELLVEGACAQVRRGADGRLYVAQGASLLEVDPGGGVRVVLRHELGPIADFAAGAAGELAVIGPGFEQKTVTWERGGRFHPLNNVAFYRRDGSPLAVDLPGGKLYAWSAAAGADGRIWLGAKQGLFAWRSGEGWKRFVPPGEELWLLGERMQGLFTAAGGSIWYGTDTGATHVDPATGVWTGVLPETGGLPFIYPRAFAEEPGGAIWAGSSIGAARRSRDGRWSYYQGQAWLPDDDVLSIAALADGRVLMGTVKGLGVIARRPMILSRKARHFSEVAQRHHVNRHGFVWRVRCRLPGELETAGESGYTDNDGLWTSSYIAAESLRFAVSGEEEARRNARRSMEGLFRLLEVTGIPGYPARSLALVSQLDESPWLASWHASPDGKHLFKSDTSSDEVVGHYFAHALYYDHVAEPAEKERQRRLIAALTDHVIEHGFHLVERADGEPTRWGIWSPERCWEWGHYWYSSGLWSLGILSHLKVAFHITGDERYEREYRRLIDEHDYARRTLAQKVLIGEVNHSDDQMALFSYYPLLRYEKDPALRATYLESLRRSWEIERPEESPTWNFVYNWAFSNRADRERSIAHLERMPWVLATWTHDNSRRWDLELAPRLRGKPLAARGLPMTEIGPYGFTDNPYELRRGDGGHTVESPAIFLLPYWLGRHHELIGEEE